MKVKVNFNEMASTLGYINTILSDKTVDEKMKRVIFLVKKDEVKAVGYSALTFSRTNMNDVLTEGVSEEEEWCFQIKSGELNKVIASYNNLFKTKVDYLEFEKGVNNKIKLIVREEPINEEDARLAQTGVFMLDSVPILESVSKEIHMDFPEECDSILSGDLLLYIDSLFPLMSNDSSSSLQSKLNFDEDYAFVMSVTNTFFVNKLPESFKGLTLGYSSVNFLKKLCEAVESIDVQRIERYLCIRSDQTEAFLKYQKVKVKKEPIVNRMSKENGIVLDRLYFKDVLKRMMVASTDGIMKMTEDGLEVSNEGFNQIIPLNNKKGDVDNIRFKLAVPSLVKTIIGDDSVFGEELFLYFVKAGVNGYMIFVTDKTGAWFSTLQVRA